MKNEVATAKMVREVFFKNGARGIFKKNISRGQHQPTSLAI